MVASVETKPFTGGLLSWWAGGAMGGHDWVRPDEALALGASGRSRALVASVKIGTHRDISRRRPITRRWRVWQRRSARARRGQGTQGRDHGGPQRLRPIVFP